MRRLAAAALLAAAPALAQGPVVWRSGRTNNAPNYVSLQHLVSFVGVSAPENAVILDWGDIDPDTVVAAATFQACTAYPLGPVEGLDATVRLYDADNGMNTASRVELGSGVHESVEGSAYDFICQSFENYTVYFDTPLELGDTDGAPALAGAAFNPFSYADIDGDGRHDFSYSLRFDLPPIEQYVFVTGVPVAGPSGGDHLTDIFDDDRYVDSIREFRNLFLILHAPGCNAADFAPPHGLLDTADLQAFIDAYLADDLLADQAAPYFRLDLADVITFVEAFTAGCP